MVSRSRPCLSYITAISIRLHLRSGTRQWTLRRTYPLSRPRLKHKFRAQLERSSSPTIYIRPPHCGRYPYPCTAGKYQTATYVVLMADVCVCHFLRVFHGYTTTLRFNPVQNSPEWLIYNDSLYYQINQTQPGNNVRSIRRLCSYQLIIMSIYHSILSLRHCGAVYRVPHLAFFMRNPNSAISRNQGHTPPAVFSL
jgi:hypothetical protein